jgi:prolyl-tRNA synthetase
MQGASFTASSGAKTPYHMGCYGLGIGRTVAAIADIHHDQAGLLWPSSAAPYAYHLIQIGGDDSTKGRADALYKALIASGKQVLFDDRDVSAGVKLSDADLLGIPTRVIVSARQEDARAVEVQHYRASQTSKVSVDALIPTE